MSPIPDNEKEDNQSSDLYYYFYEICYLHIPTLCSYVVRHVQDSSRVLLRKFVNGYVSAT